MTTHRGSRGTSTDALVRTLAAEARPVADRRRLERSLGVGAAAGLAGVVAAVLALGDVRPDLLETLGGAGLAKFGGGAASRRRRARQGPARRRVCSPGR